jgi:hypothetical protein
MELKDIVLTILDSHQLELLLIFWPGFVSTVPRMKLYEHHTLKNITKAATKTPKLWMKSPKTWMKAALTLILYRGLRLST